MAALNFAVAYATTLSGLEGQTPSLSVFAEDLGNCGTCVSLKGNCWACLTTSQQVFNDEALTSPVADGFYMVKYADDETPAVWHIIGGFPIEEGFFN